MDMEGARAIFGGLTGQSFGRYPSCKSDTKIGNNKVLLRIFGPTLTTDFNPTTTLLCSARFSVYLFIN